MLQLQWIAEGGSQVGVPVPVVARRPEADWAVGRGVAAASLLAVGLTPSAVSVVPRLSRSRSWSASRCRTWARGRCRSRCRPTAAGLPTAGRAEPRRRRSAARSVDAAGAHRRQHHHAAVLVAGQPLHRVLSGWEAEEGGRLRRAFPDRLRHADSHWRRHVEQRRRDAVLRRGRHPSRARRGRAADGDHGAGSSLKRKPSISRHSSCPTAGTISSWLVSAESGIYVGSIDSKERKRLLAAESGPLYAAPGYLLFNRGGTVFAQPFDADTLELSGEAGPRRGRRSHLGAGHECEPQPDPHGQLRRFSGRRARLSNRWRGSQCDRRRRRTAVALLDRSERRAERPGGNRRDVRGRGSVA